MVTQLDVIWRTWKDLNPWPFGPKPNALSNWATSALEIVSGFEPLNECVAGTCLSQFGDTILMVPFRGIEPLTFCLQDKFSTNWSKMAKWWQMRELNPRSRDENPVCYPFHQSANWRSWGESKSHICHGKAIFYH